MRRDPARDEAARLADELAANGAAFHFKPGKSALPASFTYELAPGGDRRRCRAIITEAKADPLVWAALLAEVARRAGGADA